MIGACTPQNLRAELERLGRDWRRGRAEAPRFVYLAPPDHRDLCRALEASAGALDREGDLGGVYAARAREIADEAAIAGAAGTPSLWALARRRFARRDRFDAEADAVVKVWLEAPIGEEGTPHEESIRSDDDRDPGSLLSRMRAAVSARRLPVRVVVTPELAALAATGDGVIQIARGRMVSAHDAARTVLHEIEGHVAPRVRAASARLAIFAVGSARGSDDQEGRALSIERRSEFLNGPRQRELALRHIAARSVEQRADFVDTVRLLRRFSGSLPDTLRVAARAHRGGGLARESVYVPAWLRHEEAVRRDPGLDRVLGRGRIAVDVAAVLAPWLE